MKKYVLDCSNIATEDDFWSLYLKTIAVDSDEAGFFGRNLSAFWDAVSAGGPGWPGWCEIEVVNAEKLMKFKDGAFYVSLCKFSDRLDQLYKDERRIKLLFPKRD